MAHKQIKTVHLKRQPHREAMQRLRLAYQQLARAVKPTSPPAEQRESRQPLSQEEATIDSQVATIEKYMADRSYELSPDCYLTKPSVEPG